MAVLLLVEDDSVLRSGLMELFTREGYRVIEAGSVREARSRLDDSVQGIVMDVGLPDGDGEPFPKKRTRKFAKKQNESLSFLSIRYLVRSQYESIHYSGRHTYVVRVQHHCCTVCQC